MDNVNEQQHSNNGYLKDLDLYSKKDDKYCIVKVEYVCGWNEQKTHTNTGEIFTGIDENNIFIQKPKI